MTDADKSVDRTRLLHVAIILVSVATVLRIAFLFCSPLELYPDEAQYWVWSRQLAFGYFSKPPMIAWLIWATTAVGGNGEAWIRLSAPILHGAAALFLFPAGRRLYGEQVGFWASILYTLIPGVFLSSAIIATDAPLMACISLGVWAYAAFCTENGAPARRKAAASLGLALGLAFLTKYAALYLAGGVILHSVLSRTARQRWDGISITSALVIGLVIAAPNITWNVLHHFQTVAHTAENADIGASDRGWHGLVGPRGPFGFLLGQFGVFGPIAFSVLIIGVVELIRRRGTDSDLLLVCLAAPAFAIVFGESVIARANANWAGAAYPPSAILVAALLLRWRKRLWLWLAVGVQGAMLVGFFIGVLTPGLADALGVGNAFKRARGWKSDANALVAAARALNVQTPLSAVAVDDRFMFNALSYYARDDRGRPSGALPAPLRAWVHLAHPANQAEAEAGLDVANGRRVMAVSATPGYRRSFMADFTHTEVAPPSRIIVELDPHHGRAVDLFIGTGFAPRPRDAKTGLPIAEPAPNLRGEQP